MRSTIAIVGIVTALFPEVEYEAVEVVVEEFEKVSVKLEERHSSEHVEEIEVGTLVNPEDLEILARIIHGESGSDWCSDKMQLYVGSVFINRVASDYFPNTFHDVAFQDGQYSCTHLESGYWQQPTERDYANAEFLLKNGSQLDSRYVWQANFSQGTDVIKEQNMYFGKK